MSSQKDPSVDLHRTNSICRPAHPIPNAATHPFLSLLTRNHTRTFVRSFVSFARARRISPAIRLSQLTDKQRTTDLWPQEVQRLEDEVSLKEDLLSQREEEIGAQSDKVETKIRNLQKVADLYGDRLGLTFKHATKDEKNNALRIGFTQIDRRNPNKEFWFDVCVTAEEAYAIRNVSPSVQGIQALEDDLNEDSDFSKFVRRMRRKFKESV